MKRDRYKLVLYAAFCSVVLFWAFVAALLITVLT